MKCNVLGWLLGLPFLALVWGLAVQAERNQIIHDLERRTQAALAGNDLEWATARFNVTEGRLIGSAYSEDERRRALQIVQRTWGVWQIDDEIALIDKAPNYVWGATVERDNLQLTGYVPNERARREILKVAEKQFPGRSVQDKMRPARGAPGEELWIDGISFGLRQLMQLKTGGRVDLNGTRLEVSGEAESVVAYRSIKGDFTRRLPSGILLAKDEVQPPSVSPFTWRATHKAGQIEFSGYVPAGADRGRIIEITKDVFPNAAIVDKMSEAGGAPENWLSAIATVIRGMANLESAEARFDDRAVVFTGRTVKELTAERVASTLQLGMPDRFQLDHRIGFVEPTLPKIDPFITTVTTDGEKVSLTGYAPDERGRQRLVAAAKQYFPNREIVDALAYGTGAPAGWLTCGDAGLLGLSKLDRGRAELRGEVLGLTGTTRDEKVAAGLPGEVRAAANRACKDTIKVEVKQPPEPELKWQAVSLDKRLELSGQVVNSDVKAALLADAQSLFPDHTIVDEMRIEPASSTKWSKVARLGLAQLAQLRSGVAQIDGLVLSLDGIAPDTAVSTAVKTRVERGIQPGYTGQVKLQVKSDAMIWSEQEAKRKSDAAASEAQRKKAQEAARLAALEEVQRRAAKVAADALAAQRELAAAKERERQQEAARLAAANTRSRDAAEAQADRRLAEVRKMAQKCKNDLNETISNGIITFEIASNQLTQASISTLDRLIEQYSNCPGARLEIAGHTDATGDAASNLSLSERRAEAVLDYFVGKGLPRDKFVARGYGETRPRIDNTTAANRARNRRIEFDVLAY